MWKIVVLGWLLLQSRGALGDGVLKLSGEDVKSHPTLCLVSEMGVIPELDTWEQRKVEARPEKVEAFEAAWEKQRPWVAEHLTAGAVRALSNWARPQMEKYETVGPLDKLKFRPVTFFKQRGLILYEATVESLPSHSPLVQRWLKVYVLSGEENKSIIRVTVTIRGQVEE